MVRRRYNGKFVAKYARRRIPIASWILVCLALLPLMTGAVAAYLSASTGAVTNKFVKADTVNPTVSETFTNNVKTDVSINVGNPGYSVYVRAAIVVTWKNSGGNVLGVVPIKDTDYSLQTGNNWTYKAADGFYYYSAPIANGNTDILITECKPLRPAPESGYTLNVEIITQTIQALGTTDVGGDPTAIGTPAITDAWGVTVGSDGNLIVS